MINKATLKLDSKRGIIFKIYKIRFFLRLKILTDFFVYRSLNSSISYFHKI